MIAKCTSCHHEWQAVRAPGSCDWCGAPGTQLALDYIEEGPSLTEMADAYLTSNRDN